MEKYYGVHIKLLLFLMMLNTCSSNTQCPSVCSCSYFTVPTTWPRTETFREVDCRGKKLKSIPLLPGYVGKLLLNNNSINQVKLADLQAFKKSSYMSINLDDNEISSIEENVFSDWSGIHLLSLQRNRLSSFSDGTFRNIKGYSNRFTKIAADIKLSGNPIRSLQTGTVRNCDNVNVILGSTVELTVQANAFQGSSIDTIAIENTMSLNINAMAFANTTLKTLIIRDSNISKMDPLEGIRFSRADNVKNNPCNAGPGVATGFLQLERNNIQQIPANLLKASNPNSVKVIGNTIRSIGEYAFGESFLLCSFTFEANELRALTSFSMGRIQRNFPASTNWIAPSWPRIYIYDNKFSSIEPNAFNECTDLDYVEIRFKKGDNIQLAIHALAFQGLSTDELVVSGATLDIKPNGFQGLTSKGLAIKDCIIFFLCAYMFEGVKVNTSLTVKNSGVSYVGRHVLRNFKGIAVLGPGNNLFCSEKVACNAKAFQRYYCKESKPGDEILKFSTDGKCVDNVDQEEKTKCYVSKSGNFTHSPVPDRSQLTTVTDGKSVDNVDKEEKTKYYVLNSGNVTTSPVLDRSQLTTVAGASGVGMLHVYVVLICPALCVWLWFYD